MLNTTLFLKKVGKFFHMEFSVCKWSFDNREPWVIYCSYKERIKKERLDTIIMRYLHYYLSIERTWNPRYTFVSPKNFIQELLNKFGIVHCNPLSTPLEQNLKLASKEVNEFEGENIYYLWGVTFNLLDQIFHLQLRYF